MGRRSSGVTMKMEVDGGIYQNVPPGFSAADSTWSRIKREVNDDVESVMDDIDNLPLSKRMRMLLAGGPSGSSSGSGSSGKVPTYCVDEAVIKEACPSKVNSDGTLDRMKVGPKQCMAQIEEFEDEADEEGENEEEEEMKGEDESEGEIRDETEPLAPRRIQERLDALVLKWVETKIYRILKEILCSVQKEGAPPPQLINC